MNVLKIVTIGSGICLGTIAYQDYNKYNNYVLGLDIIYPHSTYYYLLHQTACENQLQFDFIEKSKNYSGDLTYLYYNVRKDYHKLLTDKELSYMKKEDLIDVAIAQNNLLARQISRRALIKSFEFKLWFRCVFRDNFLLNLKHI